MGIRPPRHATTPSPTIQTPAAEPPARRDRHPAAAALLSAILPGVGQLWLGHRRRGLVMLAITLPGFAAAAAMWWRDPLTIVGLLVRPDVLVGMLVINAGICVFRLLSALDAYRLARRARPSEALGDALPHTSFHTGHAGPPGLASGRRAARLRGVRSRQLAATAAGALLAGVVITPHAVAGYYDLRLYDMLTSVFQRAPAPRAATDRSFFRGTDARALAGSGRVTALLLGGDAGPDRVGLRTDTMIVASLDARTGRTVMFGLPRNLRQVPLPAEYAGGFDCQCFPDTLNELYTYGQEHPKAFGGARPGVTAVQAGVEELLGIPIDHYALVDLKGFVDVIDALGGVTLNVARPVDDRLSPAVPGTRARQYHLRPGVRHLDGHEALAYARSRTDTDDYDRMERQRCLLGAVARQAGTASLVTGLPRLMDTAKRDVTTDIPVEHLPALVGLATVARPERMVSLSFTPGNGYATLDEEGYPVPDPDRIRQTVQLALKHPEAFTTEPTAARSLQDACE